MHHQRKAPAMRWAAALCGLLLAGCNLTTEQPLFAAADAAEVKLPTGYYAVLGSDMAHIEVIAGSAVVATQTDIRRRYDALAVALGEGVYLLQYGAIDETARSYVLLRYDADGAGIATAIYDCSKEADFFRGFGMVMTVLPSGWCRLDGGREQMLRAQRAIAKALPAYAWTRYYTAVSADEGLRGFRQHGNFAAPPRP